MSDLQNNNFIVKYGGATHPAATLGNSVTNTGGQSDVASGGQRGPAGASGGQRRLVQTMTPR